MVVHIQAQVMNGGCFCSHDGGFSLIIYGKALYAAWGYPPVEGRDEWEPPPVEGVVALPSSPFLPVGKGGGGKG